LELLSPTTDLQTLSDIARTMADTRVLDPTTLQGEVGIGLAIQQSVATVQLGLQGRHPVSQQSVLMPPLWPASETLTYTLHTLAEQIWASLATQAPPPGTLADPSKKELSPEVSVDFEVYQAALKGLSATKTTWLNHTALCKPLALASFGLTKASVLLETDTPTWLGDWCRQIALLRPCMLRLTAALGRSVPTLIARWVALSAPILYAWHYPDSATHAGQVSRLCVKTSLRLGQMPAQQLQALLVGWAHDPKLDSALSIDNVATHPIVASALAGLWLNEQVLNQSLDQIFPIAAERDQWQQGLMTALAINNDSRYVTEQLIAPALMNQLGQKGASELTDSFSKRLLARFTAASHGAPLPEIPHALQIALADTHLDSGLIGLDKGLWKKLTANEPGAETLYESICNGAVPESALNHWHKRIQEQVIEEPILTHWPVMGLALMAHHQGILEAGQPTALCLALSDPLLLSPHKILQARPAQEPLLKRLQSYVQSIRENVAGLPLLAGANPVNKMGPQWHRTIQQIIASTLASLTHEESLLVTLENASAAESMGDAGSSWDTLLSPQAWGAWGTCTDEQQPQTLVHVCKVLERQYLEWVEPLLVDGR